MDIHFFGKSDIGKVRTANEDFFLHEKISENEFLFIVADGMGGHQAGDIASRLASETFFDAYKGLRRKGASIAASIEQSIRKANTMVFKKAASDIEKRGMGTTFTAMVIAGMRASIVHVGDSRAYLIRRNRIKRLTTDHSFVEKLVEEGRISPDEARDHPQKNVLYMSLGARESFMPEIQNDIHLEDGDALVMCSDGLSNMMDDETIMNLTMGDYPEEGVNALIKLANAHGGSDNITVQVIRVGTLEMMEKTKPIRLSRPRRKLISLLALLVMLAILVGLRYVFFPPSQDDAGAGKEMAIPAPPLERKKAPLITEIDSSRLHGRGITAADCLFLSGRKLHMVKGGVLLVLDLGDRSLQSFGLAGEEQVVPSGDGQVYLLKRAPTETLGYRLLRRGVKKNLLYMQNAASLFSKGIDSSGVPFYEIPNIQERVTPDFIDENIFIFHDQSLYYAIKNWQTPENTPVTIPELSFQDSSRLFFQNGGKWMTMLHYNPSVHRATLFSLEGTIGKIRGFPVPPGPQLLALEFVKDFDFIAYYPDQCLEMRGGRKIADHRYYFNNYRIRIVKVLVDMVDNQKLVIDDGNKFFILACDP
jgi:serine/threonine protein phosphatase PrpC